MEMLWKFSKKLVMQVWQTNDGVETYTGMHIYHKLHHNLQDTNNFGSTFVTSVDFKRISSC
jgi:hypothetical protein